MCVIKQNASKTHAEKSRAKEVVPESNAKQFVPSKLESAVNWRSKTETWWEIRWD